MAAPSFADVRAKYPQYHDMSDDQLAQGLHQKFYSDVPFDQFAAKVGFVPTQTVQHGSAVPSRTPIDAPGPEIPEGPSSQQQRAGADRPTTADSGVVQGLTDTGKGIVGMAEQVPAGVASGVSAAHEALTGADPGTKHDLPFLQPHTDTGKALQAETGKNVGGAMNRGIDAVTAGNQPLADTLKERIPQALSAASVVAPGVALAARAPGLVRSAIAGGGGEAAIDAAAAHAAGPAPGTVEHPIQAAQRAGFEIAPNDVAKTSGTPLDQVPGSTLQKISETPEAEAGRNQRNVSHAGRKIGQEVGIPDTDVFPPEVIAEAKKAPGAVYTRTGEAIPSVVKPAQSTKDALQAVLDEDRPDQMASAATRKDVKRQLAGLETEQTSGAQLLKDIQFFRDDGSPASLNAAHALEKELENQTATQNPKGLADYQAAREQFAKLYDLEAVTGKSGGRVDPQAVLRLRENKNRPLTGALADVANAADAAPNSVRLPGIIKGGETPHSTVGAVALGAKTLARKLVPDQATPARQAAMAKAAGAPIKVPVGPQQGGFVTPRQLDTLGPGGPRDVMEAPPGQVTPGATFRSRADHGSDLTVDNPAAQLGLEPSPMRPHEGRPDFELSQGVGPYTPPLERGPGDVLAPAERLPQSGPAGSVISPLQREAAVPSATGPLNVSPQVRAQMRLRDENGPGGRPLAGGPSASPESAGALHWIRSVLESQKRRSALRAPDAHGK